MAACIIPVGSNFAGFNPIEIHQATGRISDTVFENNASGVGGTADALAKADSQTAMELFLSAVLSQ